MKFEYRFPDIGEGIHEGILQEWLVQAGDPIKEGQGIAEVETDKVTAQIPSAKSGVVRELRFKKGDTINVGDVFIVIDTDASGSAGKEIPTPAGTNMKDAASEATPGVEKSVEEKTADSIDADPQAVRQQELDEKEEVLEEETAGVVGEVIATSRVIPPSTEGQTAAPAETKRKKALATPVARQMAKDLDVDIAGIAGTGPNGRVMKEDVSQAAKAKAKAELPRIDVLPAAESPVRQAATAAADRDEPVERVPLTSIRRTIAARMTQSRFTIPHTTAMDEIDVTALDLFRQKYKAILQEQGVSLTYLPFIIKAVIVALKEHPEFNAEFDEAGQEIILKHFYHIGVATDTDRGLMVPVVRQADSLSIVELARAIEDVSQRARDNKLELAELKGSTFSVTNYGSIGGYFGIPIINYPEAAVLGLGRIVKKPVVVGDEIVIRKVLSLSLSYDHRIIDGASGARFLNTLRDLLTDPELLLLKA